MFGSRDEFHYFQCSSFGCLQIADIPNNINEYYPEEYFEASGASVTGRYYDLRNILIRERTRYLLGFSSLPGFLLSSWHMAKRAPVFGGWNWSSDLKKLGLGLDSTILDVGGGYGKLLHFLRSQGFANLFGVDPYIPESISDDGIYIYKGELQDLKDSFDLIMMHHSFEHMANPREVFSNLRRLLNPFGNVLLRIPLVDSMAWEMYHLNWAQLDAPRHFFLHTCQSIAILATSCGLRVDDVVYDSTGFQFWASELYAKDIPLVKTWGRVDTFFSEKEMAIFSSEAARLNLAGKGDQACFYLSRA